MRASNEIRQKVNERPKIPECHIALVNLQKHFTMMWIGLIHESRAEVSHEIVLLLSCVSSHKRWPGASCNANIQGN